MRVSATFRDYVLDQLAGVTMPYYNVPIVVLEDAETLVEWAARAVAVARTAKTATPRKRARAATSSPTKTNVRR